ncbi:MAG TPA: lysylphosphatidylglycerol synthase transmembrane domain-containing protein [Roseiflexaceae bacterium]|nr:lysylphosphatidylglycerol synthase transmembrane domain-containing protein [Roseiflexaceae bacterium]HMP39631.1 lysylphosphatidylglycerol synthase transmembrane domain-containing protein [Roseiflexaceae bacterium]
MNTSTRWLLRLIGPALLIFFLWRSDVGAILTNLRELNLLPLLISLGLMPVFVAVKSWRWIMIMRELGMQPPSLGFASALYSIGLFVGGVTPGQSGDFIKAWYLKERGQQLTPGLFSIVIDRLFDFIVMAILALVGLIAFVDVFPSDMRTPLSVATISFATLIFALTPALMARRPRERIFGLLLPLLPGRLRTPAERWRDQLAGLSMRPQLLGLLMLASVGSATSTVIRIWLLFVALPLANVPPLAIIGSTALISILQALPISFAGVGVRDAILIAVLGRYGYSAELAISLSTLFLLINIEHIIVGFLISLRYPLGQPPPADALNPDTSKNTT